MKMPELDGIIDRRILINYRVDPLIVSTLLPPHLEPLVVNGFASVGICLLRLKNIGIKHAPGFMRVNSENAAHRFLVKFRDNGQPAVFIPRRDTDSLLNIVIGNRLLSWPHFPAHFISTERNGSYAVAMRSEDEYSRLDIEAELATEFPGNSMFDSLEHASNCFNACQVGVSPSTKPGEYKTVKLHTKTWNVQTLRVNKLQSSFFEDRKKFPGHTISFDNALLMEGIEHEWLFS
ncbi:DUF2071 domain-containing protein [Chryseolinea sp. T2]|uniref:DUF2071 domain-containing protein n=1 Tax=Chryseolinea sp. T2 TaxID=3129255 RepID=UPI003076CB9A